MVFTVIAKFYKYQDYKAVFIVTDRYADGYESAMNVYKLIRNSNYQNKKIIFKHNNSNAFFVHIPLYNIKTNNNDNKDNIPEAYEFYQFQQYVLHLNLIEFDNHVYFEVSDRPVLYFDPDLKKNILL